MAEKYSILFLFSIRGDYITFIWGEKRNRKKHWIEEKKNDQNIIAIIYSIGDTVCIFACVFLDFYR
jgi:hypothetical protein